MKKTLVLSMVLCGSTSLVLAGCGDEKTGTTSNTTLTDEVGDGDGDPTGDGDGSPGDGDGTPGGDGDGSPGDGDGDCTFICNDQGGLAASCDPFAQDCPAGEKCVPYGSTGGNWDSNKCVPILGDGSPGDTCTYGGTSDATDSCGADSHCWDVMNVDGMLQGVCTEFCGGTADNPICPPQTSCLIANDGSITLCIQNCDPLLQDCGPGLACFWAVSDFLCIFTTQDIPLGEPCGYINDCVAGTGCLNADVMPNCNGSACCGSFCDLTAPECPQGGTQCSAFFDVGMAPPGYEDVGVCIIPG